MLNGQGFWILPVQGIGTSTDWGEQNHSTIRLLLQRLENLNKYVFKELLTELNKPNIDEHMLHMGLHGTWGTPVEIFAITSYLTIATSFYLYSQQKQLSIAIEWGVLYSLFPSSKLFFPVTI